MRRLLILALALWPLAAPAQEGDRGVLTAFLEDNLSGAGREVKVTGFRGALSSQAALDSLTIADTQGIWLTLNGVTLDWSRSALLSGRVEVSALVAEEVILDRLPVADPEANALPSPEATGFSLPELPVSVNIGQLAAGRVVLGPSVLGTAIEGTLEASLALAGGEGRAALRIQRTDEGPEGLVSLSASYANASGQLLIDLAAAEGPGGIAAGLIGLPGAPAAEVTLKGAGPLTDFAADLKVSTDGAERLAGRVTLRGTADGSQRFAADLRGDLAPLFLPDYAAFFGNDLRIEAEGTRAASGRLDLPRLVLDARMLDLTGRLTLAPDGLPEAFALDLLLADPEGGAVLLPLAGPETRVGRAEVRLGYDRAEGEGWTGTARLDGFDREDLRIAALALDGSGRIGRHQDGRPVIGASLTFRTEGLAPADPALAGALGPALSGKAVLSWLSGSGMVRFGQLRLDGADFGLEALGTVQGLGAGYRMQGAGELRASDLSRFAALAGRPLSGRAVAQVTGDGSPLGGDFDIEATVHGDDLALGQREADSLLRGASSLRISALRDGDGTRLRDFTVAAGGGTVAARGTIATAGSDLTADLRLPDLGVLGDGWGGGLDGRASLRGTPQDGQVTLDGTARDLATGIPELDGLLRGEGRVVLDARLRDGGLDIATASVANPQLQASGKGRLAAEGSDLTVTAALPDLAAIGGPYRGALNASARLTGTPDAGRVTLTGTGQGLRVGQPEADRLLAGASTLAADLALAEGRLTIDDLRLANPQVTVAASGTATGAETRITLDARLVNLALLVPEFPGPLTATGTVVDSAAGYALELRGRGPGQIDATVKGRVARDFASADLSVRGSAQAALANAFLGNRTVSGALEFDLRLQGRPALASLSGPVTLRGGRLSDPDLPFSLAGIEATARLAGGAAQLSATAEATTGGRIAAEGRVALDVPYSGDLRLRLEALKLRDPDLYSARVSGELAVTGPMRGGARVAGALTLTETELRIPDTGFSSYGELANLRHRNEPGPVHETRRRAGLLEPAAGSGTTGAGVYGLDVTVSAPNRVFLRGRGLDAELGGEVRLQGSTANVVPSGAMELIRGRLDILGKRLVLTSARVDLLGSLVPNLDVRATTSNDGVDTSVVIEGPADAPEVRFESAPDLPQEEVLARLLFGKGLDKISALQAAQLATAVARLAGRGGDGIVGKLRKNFGLDDLDVTTSEETGATLRAGKYLSDNLYTEIEVDQSGKSKIYLNLDVRPGVTVKGVLGSDGDTGIGVYLEKDY